MNSLDSPFFALWGRKEPIYSRIIAQTLALSSHYRRGFLEMLAARFDGRDCKQTGQHLRAAAQCQNEEVIVRPEVVVAGGETLGGILDIYIEFPSNSFGLSIENKKHSELRPRQLLRYDGCLNNMPEKFVQVFLAPSGFRRLTAEEKPPTERFESITYHDLMKIIPTRLPGQRSVFDNAYFAALESLFAELEAAHMPLKEEEVWAGQYDLRDSIDAKLENIVAGFCNENERPERTHDILLKKEIVAGWEIFRGFRRSAQGDFGRPLLKNQPEAIVYVKDVEQDSRKATLLNGLLSDLAKSAGLFKGLSAKPEFFPRQHVEEVRLVVRRPLSDFVGQNPEDIGEWLQKTFAVLRDFLGSKGQP